MTHKTFIIAEIGSNWVTKEDCLHSIRKSKDCGADAVKFQLYDHQCMYGYPGKMEGELDPSWLPDMKLEADKVGIEFMCSAFSVEKLRIVDQYVKYHKIASAEMCHIDILREIRKMNKPIFISMGSHTIQEIDKSLLMLFYPNMRLDITLMYCVPNYPAKEVKLETIIYLKKLFPYVKVGYSDHSKDYKSIPKKSVELGATAIEKHVNFSVTSGPDYDHSLFEFEFRKMVESIRITDSDINQYVPVGEDMIDKHNRRLVVIRDIKKGERLEKDKNYGIYRSKVSSNGCISLLDDYKLFTASANIDMKVGDVLFLDNLVLDES